jgi:xanthine dehydrogenase accessory factor
VTTIGAVKDVLAELDAWTRQERRVALATVIAVHRSAPRPVGAKMAVSETGEIAGAVSGGCVEGAVVELAAEVLADGGARVARFGFSDEAAWDVGLPCGGRIDVHVAPWDADGATLQQRFADAARADERAALVTVVDDGVADRGAAGGQALVTAEGVAATTLTDAALLAAARDAAAEPLWTGRSELRHAEGADLFVDVVAPAPRLLIFGAVPVAQALCRLARLAGWRPFVIDPRGRFATPERLPDAERIVVAWPDEAVAQLGGIDAATAIAVLTHDPKLDDAALALALRSDAPFIGAMGSRRATADRRERLRALGFPDEELDRVAAPFGLDIGGRSDAETALSMMAELVAHHNDRRGGPLRAVGGPIHVRPTELAVAPEPVPTLAACRVATPAS